MDAPEKVIVHPLVLLSVVDHYNRVAPITRKRVVGVLLGEVSRNTVDITNCFAVPFEEDENTSTIWYLDHSYLENMARMFKKVNAREKIVGWYSTGPKLRGSDIFINDLLAQFTEGTAPVLLICEVSPKDLGIPIQAYCSQEEVKEDGTQKARKVFVNVSTEVGQTEAEEIGVEHLLRNVKDATVSTLATDIGGKVQAVRGLQTRLRSIGQYLEKVLDGTLPVNHEVMQKLQDIYNLLPNMNVEMLSKSLQVQTNDMMLAIYLSSIIRSVLALHQLIDNKERRLWREKQQQQAKDSKVKEGQETGEGGKDKAAEQAKNGSNGTTAGGSNATKKEERADRN